MTPQEALSKCTIVADEIIYTMIRLPANAIWAGAGVIADLAEPFTAFIADKDEVTLIMPLDAWADYAERLPDHKQLGEFRLITFDIVLDFDVVGFTALIAQILATTQVPLIPIGAFSRDHILVPADSFQKAWEALEIAQKGTNL